jgi:hypothetical protein
MQTPMQMPQAMAAPQDIQPAPAGDPTMKPGMPAQAPQGQMGPPTVPPHTPVNPATQGLFDAPVPGQSLTGEPGNARYEKPPQFVDLNKALNYLWNQIISPQNMPISLAYLEKGVPPEMLADIAIFAGFSQGKWTPDLGMLMKYPVFNMFIAIAYRAGIKKTKTLYTKDKTPETIANIMSVKMDSDNEETPLVTANQQQVPPSGGFMSRG